MLRSKKRQSSFVSLLATALPRTRSRSLTSAFRILYFFSFICLLYVPPPLREPPPPWRPASYEDFLKGPPHGVAVRSDGRLELAPKFSLIADADASYLWSLRLDAKGSLFAAGGSPAKVFRFDGG